MSTATKDLVTRGEQIMVIPYTKITSVAGRNIREDYGDLGELAASIKEVGVKTPIKVMKSAEGYELVAGHRRLAAAKLLFEKDKTNIGFPSIIMDKKTTDVDMVVELMSDSNSLPLTPMEQAEAVKRLKDLKLKDDAIAKMMGRSVVYVRELYKLSQVPDGLKAAMKAGQIAPTLVRDYLKRGELDKVLAQLQAVNTEPSNTTVGADGALFDGIPGADELDDVVIPETGTKAEIKKAVAANKKVQKKKAVAKKVAAKKAAPKKITKKTMVKVNGVKEFKRFAKNARTFSSDAKEKEFYLMSDMFLQNNYSYDDFTNYFVNGKRKTED